MLSAHEHIVFFLVCPVKEKNLLKFLLASLKTLSYSKDNSESWSIIFCSASLSLIGRFPIVVDFMAGPWNNFYDQRRLSEQLLESQAAIGKPEQAPSSMRRVTFWNNVLHHKTATNFKNHLRSCKNYLLFWFLKPSTKPFISWHYHCKDDHCIGLLVLISKWLLSVWKKCFVCVLSSFSFLCWIISSSLFLPFKIRNLWLLWEPSLIPLGRLHKIYVHNNRNNTPQS
jgi:hypothetical protein